MPNIGHAGSVITIQADVTFSDSPFTVTYFPDDTDPFSADDIDIADAAMGSNGQIASWNIAAIQPFTISVMPKTDDHKNLLTLLNANVVAPGQDPNNDSITISRVMPDGTTLAIRGAVITGGPTAMSLGSDGRIKTPTFKFKGPPAVEVIA